MKILGLDSSGLVASVAVVEDDVLLGEFTVNYKKTHSQTLLPMLDELAKMIELDLNTLDAIAYNLYGHRDIICPLMDARRNQTYTGLYQFEDEKMQVLCPQCVVGIDEIVAKINENNAPVVFLGDGVPVFTTYIEENCKVPYSFAPAHVNKQRAAAVAALGEEYYKAGKLESAEEHKPEYLRLSQAERERMEQHGNS